MEEEDSETFTSHGSLLDHGMSAASKSAHQLALAVNSIPAYARASSLMLVLTPFIRHKVRGRLHILIAVHNITTTLRTAPISAVSRAGENGAGAVLKVQFLPCDAKLCLRNLCLSLQ